MWNHRHGHCYSQHIEEATRILINPRQQLFKNVEDNKTPLIAKWFDHWIGMFAEQLLFINRADLLRHPVTELSINIVPNRIFSSAILLWSFELWSKHVWQKRAPDRYLPYKQTGYHSISSISCVSLILFYLRRFYQTFFELLYAFLIARTLLLNHSHLITLTFRHKSSKRRLTECFWMHLIIVWWGIALCRDSAARCTAWGWWRRNYNMIYFCIRRNRHTCSRNIANVFLHNSLTVPF